ncbi:MAG TPA: HAMP domain-containing protein, partial [Solirubrobacteraceae bacterium]|nr:HAMP domain-containing protein [Solirubrobacteraceae bacterium]
MLVVVRYGVLGWPVGHSRSPAMMQAAGLARYQRLPVAPEVFAETVRALGAAGFAPRGLLLALVTGSLVLWAAAGVVARRLTRPLDELVRVTPAIGAGDLGARVRLGWHQPGEVGALADSVNEMAVRIERQLKEERTLLAAVSHELRSPLARLRMLVELARGAAGTERLDEIEREIVGIDALLGKLL